MIHTRAQDDYVTFEQFGFKGSAYDETTIILKAFAFAAERKLPLRLLDKVYRFSPKTPVNITGIPKIYGFGTLDLTYTGPYAGNTNQKTIFYIEGQKKLIKSNYKNLKKGSSKFFLSPNLALKNGDIIFITSAESLINNKRPYYCKGQRVVVRSYDNKNGTLRINEPLLYNINEAFFWHHSLIPEFEVDKNINFVTAPMNFITCFRIFYAKAIISGNFKNFCHTAVMFKSSFGEVRNMRADLPVTSNNGYSYCIEVSDMSNVKIYNCTLSGGRHVITSGGGGLWKKEESGGFGPAGYPSFVLIDGGIYKGTKGVNDINANNATIDSHGLTQEMIIRNATIYGGVNLGANNVTIENSTIFCDEKRLFNVGSDVVADADWGHYFIRNCTLVADTQNETGSLILCKGGINFLHLENIILKNLKRGLYVMDLGEFSPKRTIFKNFKLKSSNPQDQLIAGDSNGNIEIFNSDLKFNTINK